MMRVFRLELAFCLVLGACASRIPQQVRCVASEDCEASLRGKVKLVDNIIPAYRLPLTNKLKQLIQKHDGLKQLAIETQVGRGLGFRLVNIPDNGDLGRTSLLGEFIQSLLIENVLRERFPRAEILYDHTAPSESTKKVIELYVQDLIEIDAQNRVDGEAPVSHRERIEVLDMLILKNGNPSTASLDRARLRAQFGFRDQDKVCHYYYRSTQTSKLYAATVSNLAFEGEAQFVLVTGNVSYDSSLVMELKKFDNISKVLLLSELGLGDLDKYRPAKDEAVVILNDLSGYKSILDAVSNVSVIEGPINHAEALNVGVPVISLIEPGPMEGYDKTAFKRSLTVLKGTGGLFQVDSLDRVTSKMLAIWKKPPLVQPPYMIPTKALDLDSTPFHLLLDHLVSVIRVLSKKK